MMSIDPNHPFTLHHTYTGKGCAICGQEAKEHKQDYWLVDGKQQPAQLEKETK